MKFFPILVLLMTLASVPWALGMEIPEGCGEMGALGAGHREFTKLVKQSYRIVTDGVEYDLEIRGFDNYNKGVAYLTMVAYDDDSYEEASEHRGNLTVFKLTKLQISKDKKTLSFIDEGTDLKFQFVLELTQPLSAARPEINAFKFQTVKDENSELNSGWTYKNEFFLYPRQSRSILYENKEAREIIEILPEAEQGRYIKYRGLQGVKGNELSRNVISGYLNTNASFIYLQHGLRALGLRSDHPLLQVKRPDEMGLGKFDH